MKKALALLLLAGLAFAPIASFADVADESLGQGSYFDAALRTGSSDLVQLFPEQASNFSNTFFMYYGTPDYEAVPGIPPAGGTDTIGYDGNGLLSGSDNWFGVIDSKHGIGTWAVFINVPVDYFTDNAGGNPDLYLGTETDGFNNTYTAVGGFDPTDAAGYGATTNNWGAVVNHWTDWNGTGYSNVGGGNVGASGGRIGEYLQTPNNKFVVTFADQGFGLSLNYGDQAGDYWDFTGNTNVTVPANPAAGTYLGYKQYADQVQEYGLSLGLGGKDVGPFSNLDVAASFELGTIDLVDSQVEENAAGTGVNNYYQDSMKDNGIYDVRVNVLAVKDSDENTQLRLSTNDVLSQLGTKEVFQEDNNNNGSFLDAGDDNEFRDTTFANLDINVNAGCVHKIEDGKGRFISSIGVQYRNQHFTDESQEYSVANAQFQPVYYSDSDYTNFLVPIHMGAEQDLFDWLTLRLGATANAFQSYSDKTIGRNNQTAEGVYQNVETDNSWSDQFANVIFTSGFGVKFGNFGFDALLNEDVVENNMLVNIAPGAGTLFTGNLVTVAKVDGTFKF